MTKIIVRKNNKSFNKLSPIYHYGKSEAPRSEEQGILAYFRKFFAV